MPRHSYVCNWCSTGKPLWVKEPFRNTACRSCKKKPLTYSTDGGVTVLPIRTPAEITEEFKKRLFDISLRKHKTARVIIPDRRDGRSSL